jgi:biotin synthase-related radical SAM superfamily protein
MTLRAETGEIVLAISAFNEWEKNPSMVTALEKKLSNYIKYIEGGQYAKEYGNDPVCIQIVSEFNLSKEAEELVKKVERSSGIEIQVSVMGEIKNPWQ